MSVSWLTAQIEHGALRWDQGGKGKEEEGEESQSVRWDYDLDSNSSLDIQHASLSL